MDLSVIRMREKFVVARTMLLNAARGIVKGFGHRLPSCSENYFAERCREVIPVKLRSILMPLLEQIASLSKQIAAFDRQVDRLALAKYSETAPLLTVNGIGTLTAVTFVLTLGDKSRFRDSRDVGCYLGCGLSAISPAHVIRNSASPSGATGTCDPSWFNAPDIACTILSEASRPIRERDCHALRCYAGTAPVTKQSGKRRIVSMRQACSARIREADLLLVESQHHV